VGNFHAAKAHFIACHKHPVNQVLHHITNLLAIVMVSLLLCQQWRWLIECLVISQIFALSGHAAFEKNQPAAIKYPGITIFASLSWSFDRWFGLRQFFQNSYE
jgi:hypothetical protein